jgi:tRNA modification GTPase
LLNSNLCIDKLIKLTQRKVETTFVSGGLQTDLIAAVATAPGQGGIGVVRLSGQGARGVAEKICGRTLQPRYASYCDFRDRDEILDQGLALLFDGTASFTGEEVVELQGHGGPVVLQRLLDAVCSLGARLARPGEFSERAFLNGKIDLAQAEAIADLIASTSVAAAKAAVRSLRGVFSEQVHSIADELGGLRVLVEACIDFPEEDVEFLQNNQVSEKIEALVEQLEGLLNSSEQGQLLNEGLAVAIIGEPNAGKSSLLNVLSGEDAAIVTDIPGTTRDLLKVDLVLDGLPLRLVDTAGLRESEDVVERLGVDRAKQQIRQADLLLVVLDASTTPLAEVSQRVEQLLEGITHAAQILLIMNKSDLVALQFNEIERTIDHQALHWVSAKTGVGIDELRIAITDAVGFRHSEATFTARARHVSALNQAIDELHKARSELADQQATEIVAEELRSAHSALGEIVGTVTPDDLLGRIFSEFCIGK